MKKIIIFGANSYLGNSLSNILSKYGYTDVNIVDAINFEDKMNDISFVSVDVIVNVSGIVHRPNAKKDLYYLINRNLAIEIAKKAKSEGVKQFIQMSTRGVFGIDKGITDENTQCKPKTYYEKSKYEADLELIKLNDTNFKVCICRPPIIYGIGCKGNFPMLERYAKKESFFPNIKNKKDMIYIGNICDFICFAIKNGLFGIFYPRDPVPICVSELVKKIALLNGNNLRLIRVFNPFIYVASIFNHKVRAVFCTSYCTIDDHSNWNPPFLTEDALNEMYTLRGKQ